MPNIYNKDHFVDEFGRTIPYDTLKGTFTEGTPNEAKQKILQDNYEFRYDGSVTSGKSVKQLMDDTYGFYGGTTEPNQGRKLFVGDIRASYNKDAKSGTISTHIITDRDNIKEKSRYISATIDGKQYNQYMASTDKDRIKLASDWLGEIRLESTRDRVAEIKDIRILTDPKKGFQMTANVDGEDIHRNITDLQMSKMMLLTGENKEKLFAKVFECKGVKPTPGETASINNQITNAVTSAYAEDAKKKMHEIVENEYLTKKDALISKGVDLKGTEEKVSQVPTQTPSKASDLVNANFEQISQGSAEQQNVSQGIHR